MDRYVLPPEFDFLNNTDIDPIVMYMFEFEYSFDKDDLSIVVLVAMIPVNLDFLTTSIILSMDSLDSSGDIFRNNGV